MRQRHRLSRPSRTIGRTSWPVFRRCVPDPAFQRCMDRGRPGTASAPPGVAARLTRGARDGTLWGNPENTGEIGS
jgi:hypothetical protein